MIVTSHPLMDLLLKKSFKSSSKFAVVAVVLLLVQEYCEFREQVCSSKLTESKRQGTIYTVGQGTVIRQ